MTWFSALGGKRFLFLTLVFAIAVACAKVDRGYYDEGSLAGAENGGSDATAGKDSGAGGKAGSGAGGKAGSGVTFEAGAAGEGGEAGSAGESSAGAAGAAGAASGSLTVILAGSGKGVVTSDVGDIDCGSNCSAELDPGTKVALIATPDADSTFNGWSGGGCSGTGTCVTTTSEAGTTVKATFAARPKLIVTLGGTGSGVVKSVPDGIDCGTTCSALFPPGTAVQLTATPATGSAFTGWSGGGCTGTGPCSINLTDVVAVTATFSPTTSQTLTVVKAGTGLGTITSAPAGINCGTDCSESLPTGTVVTLTAATTGTGSVFSGWSGGGCTGTGTCAVTLTAATQVTANFTCSAGTATINYSGAIVNYTVPSCVTSLTIEAFGAQGGASSTYAGGAGARMKGTFAVTGGAVLKVLVGGKGNDTTDTAQQCGGTGGGGTFVTTSSNSALIVAGGGGGAVNNVGGGWSAAGLPGVITTAGSSDVTGTNAGGVNGNGGVTDNNTGYHSGTGGGGLLGNGVGNSSGNASSFGTPAGPGQAFVNGGAGGLASTCTGAAGGCIVGRVGGFGGGGAAGYTGGGGGGYSGGGAGRTVGQTTAGAVGQGGGGGSINTGTAQSNTAGARTGNGMVVFTY